MLCSSDPQFEKCVDGVNKYRKHTVEAPWDLTLMLIKISTMIKHKMLSRIRVLGFLYSYSAGAVLLVNNHSGSPVGEEEGGETLISMLQQSPYLFIPLTIVW